MSRAAERSSAKLRAHSSTDRAQGCGPWCEGSIPSEPFKFIGIRREDFFNFCKWDMCWMGGIHILLFF